MRPWWGHGAYCREAPACRLDSLRGAAEGINTVGGELADGKVAAYPAKYATKATEAIGHESARLSPATIDDYADPEGDHAARLIDACWHLGRPTHTAMRAATPQPSPTVTAALTPNRTSTGGLRRWAHMLGFGGLFLTKARRYSVTFGRLRDSRATYRRTEDDELADTIPVGTLTYIGSGWLSDGDALLYLRRPTLTCAGVADYCWTALLCRPGEHNKSGPPEGR